MAQRAVLGAGIAGALVLSGVAIAQANQPTVAASAKSAQSERECLARAMYFESEKSADDGMLAVGTVVANRVKSGRYGGTMCSVVAQPGQFAPGVMSRAMTGVSADRARLVADAVLRGHRHPGAKNAMFFHTAGLKFRYPNMHYVLVSGGNIFYEKRSASDPAATRANALSMARVTAAAKVDQANVRPVMAAALAGAKPMTVASNAGPNPRYSAYDMFKSQQAQQGPLGYAPSDARAQAERTGARTALDAVAAIDSRPTPLPPSRPAGAVIVQAKADITVLPPKRPEMRPDVGPQLASLEASSRPAPVPTPRPRVITPSAPVQAAMGPVPAAHAPTLASAERTHVADPRANLVVAMAWSAFY